MLHEIPTNEIGPYGPPMAEAVQTCVHCGFCLPTCPTYQVLGEEMDSPRGRIFLMKEVLEGGVELDEAMPYIDRCLGCVACVTACPSGVQYGELLTPFRARAEEQRRRGWFDRLLRWMMLRTLPFPGRFRWAARMGRLGRPFRFLMPRRMRGMMEMLPGRLPPRDRLPEVHPPKGDRRARVALLAGCAQQVLAPEINRATLEVLAENGVEVVIPREQGCCGALAAHTGVMDQAKDLARRNIRAFSDDVDAVLTNAAGCGSGMHEYGLWLRGEPEQAAAEKLAARSRDVSVFLDELGFKAPPPLKEPLTVAYHDACHLGHAQKVTAPPRRLLSAVDNLTVAEITDAEICCGSAGTYNIEQPEIAADLGRRKAQSILATDASVVATGNIGCLTQIQMHLAGQDRPLPVMHTMELLARVYRGESSVLSLES